MASQPCSRSSSPLSEGSVIGTPSTERSVLFGEELDSFDDAHEEFVLVTGGLGFIGSHTSLELLKSGHNVIIVDNLSNAFDSVLERVVRLAKSYHKLRGSVCPTVKFCKLDYRDSEAMSKLLDEFDVRHSLSLAHRSRITGVIHFAAYKAVSESIQIPLKYYRNNVSGLIDFVALLGEYGIKNLIFSSSATVYGSLADRGVPLKEEDCVHHEGVVSHVDGSTRAVKPGCVGITNPYGRTKWMCEAILADLAASDSEWSITALRYFNPIGCDPSGLLGEDPRQIPTNLLPVVAKVMTGEYSQLSVFGSDWDTPDGTAIRDFIHVTDLARGHIAALRSIHQAESTTNFNTFNLGTGSGHSVREVVTAMEAVSEKPIAQRLVDRRVGDVGFCVAGVERSQQVLEWKTEKSLEDACRDLCNFLRRDETDISQSNLSD
ncbi:MAG: hypothetical protein Q9160_002516 [Pyrenula sp. 1 TL-2023]